jgi:hypothetical protein
MSKEHVIKEEFTGTQDFSLVIASSTLGRKRLVIKININFETNESTHTYHVERCKASLSTASFKEAVAFYNGEQDLIK